MVKSKKQEIFRKLNSNSGVGDSDVGKWVFSYPVLKTNMHVLNDRKDSVNLCACKILVLN